MAILTVVFHGCRQSFQAHMEILHYFILGHNCHLPHSSHFIVH